MSKPTSDSANAVSKASGRTKTRYNSLIPWVVGQLKCSTLAPPGVFFDTVARACYGGMPDVR